MNNTIISNAFKSGNNSNIDNCKAQHQEIMTIVTNLCKPMIKILIVAYYVFTISTFTAKINSVVMQSL